MTRTFRAITLLAIALLWAGSATAQLVEVEQRAMSDTFQYALENNPTDQAADWVNPDTDHAGAVVPVRTFTNARGQPCREFITTVIVGGEQQQGYGTACRQPNGTWQIVSDEPPAQVTTVVNRPVYVYRPAARYYVYPHAYYNPYRIYFSFSWLFNGGRLHVGSYYPGASVWYHRYYYRYPLKHHKHRHYAPLQHHRWYRRDHIHRSWHRRHNSGWHRTWRKYPDRYIHRDRGRVNRHIFRDKGRIEQHIHRDRKKGDRHVQPNRTRRERSIQQNRSRAERRIHRSENRNERRIHSDRSRIERRIHPERKRGDRSIRRDRTRHEQRTFREGGRSGRRLYWDRSRSERRFNRL